MKFTTNILIVFNLINHYDNDNKKINVDISNTCNKKAISFINII